MDIETMMALFKWIGIFSTIMFFSCSTIFIFDWLRQESVD